MSLHSDNMKSSLGRTHFRNTGRPVGDVCWFECSLIQSRNKLLGSRDRNHGTGNIDSPKAW